MTWCTPTSCRPTRELGKRAVGVRRRTQPIDATTGTGSWNAAHFNSAHYDTLSRQYIAAVDLSIQRSLAGQIQTLLLNVTPIIYGYFYNHLSATAKSVAGVYPTASGGLFLNKAVKA
jgi:ABC-type transport system substrate-binding protein